MLEAPRRTQSDPVWCSNHPNDRLMSERPSFSPTSFQPIHGAEVFFVPVAILIHLVLVEARARQNHIGLVLASEHAACERVIVDDGNSVTFWHWRVFLP